MSRSSLVVVVFALTACGGKKADDVAAKHDAAVRPAVAPVAMPISGVDQIKRMNFVYAEGSPAYAKARAAYAAKPERDWAGVRTHTEAALAKDTHHLDAHWLLGVALAHAGEHAAAVDHLVTALSADHGQYDPLLTREAELKAFLATPHGAAVSELAAKIRADYAKRIAGGVLVVGRRSAFKWPDKPGIQPASTRGELYAYDRETRRYLRLTHTDHQVAGFVRSPAGGELAVLGFDRIDRSAAKDPKDAKDAKDAKDDPPSRGIPSPQGAFDPSLREGPKSIDSVRSPLITRAWVIALDTTEWRPAGPRATVAAAAREVAVGYGAGDQLLVATAPAAGRWGTGEPAVSSLDRSTGKLTKLKAALPAPRITLSLDDGRLVRVPDSVKASWSGDPPTAPSLELAGKSIAVPESGAAAQATVAVAPDGGHLAFATAVDPCAKDAAPSLYVAVARTGALKHLLTAKSRFPTRWIDATTLAYEDGDGAIRLWDAASGREALKLDNRAGLALDVLSLGPAPLCKQSPPTADAAGSGDEPPLPVEEPASPGPVTKP